MSEGAKITVTRGSLYLSWQDYERYFRGRQAVILLRRACDLLILPVSHAAAGGYLLKMRNAAGDRVVAAGGFFRDQGFADNSIHQITAIWSGEQGGLVATNAFQV